MRSEGYPLAFIMLPVIKYSERNSHARVKSEGLGLGRRALEQTVVKYKMVMKANYFSKSG